MHLSTHVQNSLNSLETTTFVNYDGVVAKIVRPDIECTNGYIHLIDKVVVKVNIQFKIIVINLTSLIILEARHHPWRV